MLAKNFFREMFSTLPRLMSVIIVSALGVCMFVGMSGINYNLIQISDSYYSEQNVADYWIYGNLSKTEEKKIAQIKGVAQVQPEVVFDAQPVRDKEITVTLHGVAGEMDINRPYMISGHLPRTNREIVLYDDYAKKHNLQIGDSYELKLKDKEKKVKLTLCGTARSPEYIYNINGIDLIPDSYKLGFGFLKAEALEDVLGPNIYNRITVKLEEGTDPEAFKRDLDDALGNKVSSLVSFEDNKKASMLKDSIKEMAATTTSLPTLFFLISALIMFTTMTRIIESARMQIGTLKALGYGDFSIFLYYLSYAQVVVILGVALGTLPSILITSSLMEVYKTSYSLPNFTTQFSIDAIIQSVIITNIFCSGTAAYICYKELKETPSECIRPKQAKNGNKNFVERIAALWKRMTFTQKTIVRNIFRNKMRLVMCVAGVAGCMSIIITAFGMSDSNNRFFDMLFQKLYRYDIQVTLKGDVTDAQYKRIQNIEGVDKCEYQMSMPATYVYGNKKESANITVVEDEISLMLLDINSEGSMKMPKRGAVVSSTLSKKLGLKAGDTLRVELAGRSKTISVEVEEILKNINGIYVGRSVWRSLGEEYKPTTAYINSAVAQQVKDEIAGYEFVLAAQLKGEVVAAIESQLGTMRFVVFLLTVFGGVLALVVLYNLGIMNYFERMRELATLMVLGFYNKEIKVLVLRENTIFTLIGIVLGIPMGIWFHGYLMGSGESAGYEVDVYIAYLTYFIAAGLTLMFSMLVNMMLGKKFKEIDMIGALKSVE